MLATGTHRLFVFAAQNPLRGFPGSGRLSGRLIS